MIATVGKWADRLLSVVVPQTEAGACPCGDIYCSSVCCSGSSSSSCTKFRYYTNCNCQIVQATCDCR